MKNLEKSLPKWLKPLKFKRADPNEIIEVQDDYRQIHGLPPERITRAELGKRMERQYKKDIKELRKFLKTMDYLEKLPAPNIRFGYNAPAYN